MPEYIDPSIKYDLYRIGLTDSRIETGNIKESYSFRAMRSLTPEVRKNIVTLLRLMADSLESGTLSKEQE